MDMSMEKIMEASFGEVSNTIRATYKKTVLIRQYETEVMEVESVVDMGDEKISGAERMLLSALLQAQIEYTTYVNLAYKGQVTNSELIARKEQLIEGVQAIKTKAEAVLGVSMNKYFEHLDKDLNGTT